MLTLGAVARYGVCAVRSLGESAISTVEAAIPEAPLCNANIRFRDGQQDGLRAKKAPPQGRVRLSQSTKERFGPTLIFPILASCRQDEAVPVLRSRVGL